MLHNSLIVQLFLSWTVTCWGKYLGFQKEGWIPNGAFTLLDTDADTDADKLAQNPMEICVGVLVLYLRTILNNPFLSVLVLGSDHTIKEAHLDENFTFQVAA